MESVWCTDGISKKIVYEHFLWAIWENKSLLKYYVEFET